MQNSIDYKTEVKKFLNIIKKYKLDDIISIDETSIHSAMVKEYCKFMIKVKMLFQKQMIMKFSKNILY